MEKTYKKVVADGVTVGVYTGDLPLKYYQLVHLRGIHVEPTTKEVYDIFRKKKPKKEKQESYFLPGWRPEIGIMK